MAHGRPALKLGWRLIRNPAHAGIQPSMGPVGDRFDNALVEDFISTQKVELVYRASFRTCEEADLALFRYIDGWYGPHAANADLARAAPTSTRPPTTPS
jgi:putative transposase